MQMWFKNLENWHNSKGEYKKPNFEKFKHKEIWNLKFERKK